MRLVVVPDASQTARQSITCSDYTLHNVLFPAWHVQDMCEPAARQQQQQFLAAQCASLAGLWRSQQLVDLQLQSADGDLHGAHRVVLASSSGFFRALLCGAGQSMKEGSSSSNCSLQDSIVVQLPYSSQQLSSLLTILYEHSITVRVCGHCTGCCLSLVVCVAATQCQMPAKCCRHNTSCCLTLAVATACSHLDV